MLRLFSMLGLGLLAGCAVPVVMPARMPPPAPVLAPQVPAPVVNPGSAKDRFIAAVAANGCALTPDNTPLVQANATLAPEDLGRIMTELRAEGRGEIGPDGRSFVLTTGACV